MPTINGSRYQWANITIGGEPMPMVKEIKYTVTPSLCTTCRKRHMYTRCSVCSTAQCALCSWTTVGQHITAEVCRACRDRA